MSFYSFLSFLLNHANITNVLPSPLLTLPDHRNAVKEKHNVQLKKLEAERDAVARLNEQKIKNSKAKLRNKLDAAVQKLMIERHSWEDKLDDLNSKLNVASARVYTEKRRHRINIQKQIDATIRQEAKLQNYIDGFSRR